LDEPKNYSLYKWVLQNKCFISGQIIFGKISHLENETFYTELRLDFSNKHFSSRFAEASFISALVLP
jgi:hypothetical protein